MVILQKLYDFNLPNEEMIDVYYLFLRCMVEYCCVVWHSSITEEERTSIECVQKTALRIILKEDYVDYSSALELTGLESLDKHLTQLPFNFAKKCLKSDKTSDLFPCVSVCVSVCLSVLHSQNSPGLLLDLSCLLVENNLAINLVQRSSFFG
jgi:hypothetical protein